MAGPPEVSLRDGALIVRVDRPFSVASWAPWNPGIRRATTIVNLQVPSGGKVHLDPQTAFAEAGARFGFGSDAIGMMTAAEVSDYQESLLAVGDLWVHVVGTVGLTNARSVLDEADVSISDVVSTGTATRFPSTGPGTINLIISTNALPGDGGRFQAIQVASAAKTAALRDGTIRSRKSDRPADLTGTDCIVMASSGEIPSDHCGLHTTIGSLIGRAVHEVVGRGVRVCLERKRPASPPCRSFSPNS